MNSVLHGITLPGASTLARYSADDMSVKGKAEIDKVSKKVSRYEMVTRAKINHKFVGLRKGVSFLRPFTWTERPLKIQCLV